MNAREFVLGLIAIRSTSESARDVAAASGLIFDRSNSERNQMPKSPMMAEREAVLARELGLTIATVHNSVRRLREAGHIDSSRPVAPPLTSRDLARMIMGQCGVLPVNAPEAADRLGALPRLSGDGATTLETEIVDLLDEAAGVTNGNLDFRSGDMLVSIDGGFAVVSGIRADGLVFNRTYRREATAGGMRRIVQIPLPTLRRIAQQLL